VSRFLAWRQLLLLVKPETLIRWHRQGFRLFWRWKSRTPGRPAISREVQRLIATMAAANRMWGEERVANELLLKLGIRVSPRAVRRYMPSRPRRPKPGMQAWRTFVRNHAREVLASDFFVVTATFRILYVFVVLEVGTRRILHWNVTAYASLAISRIRQSEFLLVLSRRGRNTSEVSENCGGRRIRRPEFKSPWRTS
jgi:putative transposase